ncbi:MAG: hypothetical protein AAB423_02180 [Patescibacteria group bacterium]
MATKQKEWKDMSKVEKTMTVLILPIILIVIIAVASAIFGGDKKTDEQLSKADTSETETAQPAPKFDTYLNRPMSEVASEFGQTYDPANSTQIRADKAGYKLFFEDGGRDDPTNPLKKQNTGQVTTVNMDLPQMGKCKQDQVLDKVDDAMRAAGLNPDMKGDKSGTQEGYATYKNYLDKESLELTLFCEYNDANYKLQIRVLPEFR